MIKKILVTGANGFVGTHLCRHLVTERSTYEVIGAGLGGGSNDYCASYYEVDLSSKEAVQEIVATHCPDAIYHLAGLFGENDLERNLQTNVITTSLLLDNVARYAPSAVFISAGSAAEYGRAESDGQPVAENHSCQPVTPYGLTKKMASDMVLYYHRARGLQSMVVRPFQLLGKGVSDKLAPGAFARKIEEAVEKKTGVIQVGNLESFRDFLDIEDAVNALHHLLLQPKGGHVFNICSGEATKMSQLLEMMISVSGQDIDVETAEQLMRGSADVSIMYGSRDKIEQHCGWQPQVSLQQSIAKMLA